MVATYKITGENNIASPADTALTVAANATTPQRNEFLEIEMGHEGAPGDNTIVYIVQRVTALGTGSAITPRPTDPADRASQSVCAENHTAEPTYTANEELVELPVYQRASWRIVPPPRAPLITPATVANGLGFFANHASVTTLYRMGGGWVE